VIDEPLVLRGHYVICKVWVCQEPLEQIFVENGWICAKLGSPRLQLLGRCPKENPLFPVGLARPGAAATAKPQAPAKVIQCDNIGILAVVGPKVGLYRFRLLRHMGVEAFQAIRYQPPFDAQVGEGAHLLAERTVSLGRDSQKLAISVSKVEPGALIGAIELALSPVIY